MVGIRKQYRRAHPDWTDEQLDSTAKRVCGVMESGGLSFSWASNVGSWLEGAKNIVRISLKTSEPTGEGSPWAKFFQDDWKPHESRGYPVDDLRLAARSASFRPIGIDHGETSWKDKFDVGMTFFTDFEDQTGSDGKARGVVEGFGTIFDDELYGLIKPSIDPNREIEHVSIDFYALNPVQVDGTELHGIYIPAVHLMLNQIPGDPYATIEKVTLPQGSLTVEGMETMGGEEENTKATWPPAGAPSNYVEEPWVAGDFAVATEKERHLPHHWNGKLNEAGVVAALKRLHQYEGPDKDGAKTHLCAHAKELKIDSEVCGTGETIAFQVYGTAGGKLPWGYEEGGRTHGEVTVVPLPAAEITKETMDTAIEPLKTWIETFEKTQWVQVEKFIAELGKIGVGLDAVRGKEYLTPQTIGDLLQTWLDQSTQCLVRRVGELEVKVTALQTKPVSGSESFGGSSGFIVPDLATGLGRLSPEEFHALFQESVRSHSLGDLIRMKRELG